MELQFVVEQLNDSEHIGEGSGDIKKAKEELITCSTQIEKTQKEVEQLNYKMKSLQTHKSEAEKHLQSLQLEYCQTQARKYKLMSKSKHASAKLND